MVGIYWSFFLYSMLRRKREINIQLSQIFDMAACALLFWAAHQIRWRGTVWFDLPSAIPPFSQFLWVAAVIVPAFPLLLDFNGYYENKTGRNMGDTIGTIIKSFLWLSLLLAIVSFTMRLPIQSRAVILMFGVASSLYFLVRDRMQAASVRRKALRGRHRERVLLVGKPADRESLVREISSELDLGLEVVGELDLDVGCLGDLRSALHKHSVGHVFFAASHSKINTVEAAIQLCEVEGVDCHLFADFIRTSIARPVFDTFGRRQMLSFRTTPDFSWALLFKEMFDRVAAALALVILAPFLFFVVLGVKLSSRGPVLFKQERSGRHGRPFRMLKFRTMFIDAEEKRAELLAQNEMSGPVFKIAQDPRITSLGRWLRKFSIDELPQLINVVRGEMSLVGPRPLPIYETNSFADPSHRRRLSVRPGLTCLWQICGRNTVTDFDDWVRLDLEYIDNWSLWLDFKILLLTIPVVLSGAGAR